MSNTCTFGSSCYLIFIGISLGWWLLASALLWLTWNHTISSLFKVKQTRFRNAALLVATLCVFASPCYFLKQLENCRHSCSMKNCHHGSTTESPQGDCPYSHHGERSEAAPAGGH